ncbi:hypothetical protein [Heyndrickxia acidicola]|uniref:Uncharacterized protein n=1 Tax=Heyndrickxia acidicola TaxID=209389 RepID=A0ABU6MFL2_9BACI|nr:hypothetical protein [Heyndrickxia acidicola]MED1203485.1 hypothetical protein [Heyndrickxia acidicola]
MTHFTNQPTGESRVYRTGETVLESGHYVDADGQYAVLQKEESFPACPKTGNSVTWSFWFSY